MANSAPAVRGIRLPFWPIAAAIAAMVWCLAEAARPAIDVGAAERSGRRPRAGLAPELLAPRWADDQQVRLPDGTRARWGELKGRLRRGGPSRAREGPVTRPS